MNWKQLAIILIFTAMILGNSGQEARDATPAGKTIFSQSILMAIDEEYTVSSNIVATDVSSIHGIDINENDPETVLPTEIAYFSKILTNVGNVSENITFILSPVTTGWSVQLIEDTNRDGVRQPGEITPVPLSLTLNAASDFRFFVAMTAPNTINVVGTVNLTVSASAASLGVYHGYNLIAYGGPAIVSATHTAYTILQPGAPGSPVFADLKFDGIPFVDGDYIGITPLISAKILDEDGVVTSSIQITIDGITITEGITWDGTYMTYKVTSALGVGSHTFFFQAHDVSQNIGIKEVHGKITEKVRIVGRVLPYPSPYDPLDGDAKITYQLTNDSDIRIYLHNIVGERLWAVKIDKGEEGGHAGYNEVLWNGEDNFHNRIGNGVYIVHIIDGKGKLLGKTKILVIR